MNDVTPERWLPVPGYVRDGQRFNRWVVLTSATRQSERVLCRCDCGTERRVLAKNLRQGLTRSCGCLRRDSSWLSDLRAQQEAAPYVAAGRRFGMLTTLEDAAQSQASIRCRCDCGTEQAILAGNLRNPKGSKSCGCTRRAVSAAASSAANTTHGLSKHPLYGTWRAMCIRTTSPTASSYVNYGARGVRVYEQWRLDPIAFITWITETLGPRPPGCSLDRIDNEAHYEPGNLRWATAKQQGRNKRSIRDLTRERDALRTQLQAVMKAMEPTVRRRRQRPLAQQETLF